MPKKADPGALAWRAQLEAQKRALFLALCRTNGLPTPAMEHRFYDGRRWRFDYAWPEHRIALEVEGGVWTGGRHTRGAGFLADMEKYNMAAVTGWAVLRTTPDKLETLSTIDLIAAAIAERKAA